MCVFVLNLLSHKYINETFYNIHKIYFFSISFIQNG